MAGTIRFHLDEHVAGAVALGLRLRAIDVTLALETIAGLVELGEADIDDAIHFDAA